MFGTQGRACTDYRGVNAIKNYVANNCPLSAAVPANANKEDPRIIGVMTRDSNGGGINAGISITAITDGTSNTIMLGEDAGGPFWYGVGGQLIASSGTGVNKEGGWCDPNANFSIDGSLPGCTSAFVGNQTADVCVPSVAASQSCPANCTNDSEFYAFHPAGANAVFADGSVHFISKSISVCTVGYLVTRAGGEVIPPDFQY